MSIVDCDGQALDPGDTVHGRRFPDSRYVITDVYPDNSCGVNHHSRPHVHYQSRPDYPIQWDFADTIRLHTKGNTNTVTTTTTLTPFTAVPARGTRVQLVDPNDHTGYLDSVMKIMRANPVGTVGPTSSSLVDVLRDDGTRMYTVPYGALRPADVMFSAEIVVEKVFDYAGCDEGKMTWLNLVGLPKGVVTAIRGTGGMSRPGDIVKYTAGPNGDHRDREFTIGRLYVCTAESDTGYYFPNDEGRSLSWRRSLFEMVQPVRQKREVKIPDSFTMEKVVTQTFNDNHGTRTREQRLNWLATVGITEAQVDEILTPPARPYDIVKCTVAGITGGVKLGCLYSVKEVTSGGDNGVGLKFHGVRGIFPIRFFEVVQTAKDKA